MSKRPRTPEVANAVRDAMVDAATRVFAKKGFAAATMKEIAVEAGYTAPAFYNYFAGKEELYEALLARTFPRVPVSLDPRNRLMTFSIDQFRRERERGARVRRCGGAGLRKERKKFCVPRTAWRSPSKDMRLPTRAARRFNCAPPSSPPAQDIQRVKKIASR